MPHSNAEREYQRWRTAQYISMLEYACPPVSFAGKQVVPMALCRPEREAEGRPVDVVPDAKRPPPPTTIKKAGVPTQASMPSTPAQSSGALGGGGAGGAGGAGAGSNVLRIAKRPKTKEFASPPNAAGSMTPAPAPRAAGAQTPAGTPSTPLRPSPSPNSMPPPTPNFLMPPPKSILKSTPQQTPGTPASMGPPTPQMPPLENPLFARAPAAAAAVGTPVTPGPPRIKKMKIKLASNVVEITTGGVPPSAPGAAAPVITSAKAKAKRKAMAKKERPGATPATPAKTGLEGCGVCVLQVCLCACLMRMRGQAAGAQTQGRRGRGQGGERQPRRCDGSATPLPREAVCVTCAHRAHLSLPRPLPVAVQHGSANRGYLLAGFRSACAAHALGWVACRRHGARAGLLPPFVGTFAAQSSAAVATMHVPVFAVLPSRPLAYAGAHALRCSVLWSQLTGATGYRHPAWQGTYAQMGKGMTTAAAAAARDA